MGLYPFNTNKARTAQSDVTGVKTDLLSVVRADLGSPLVDDVDWFVESTNMKVGAYTLAHTAPDVPRNVTVTQTAVDAEDTNGTIVVVGTDINDEAITETIIPNAGETVAGAKAFKTVTSVTGAGWVIGEGNDTITVGFGGKVGLPDKLANNTVLFAVFNAVREATAPTVTFSSTVLSQNTVDFNSAWDGSVAEVYYIV